MSKTTDFIINNPGKDFDGSDILPFDEGSPHIPTVWEGFTKKELAAKADEAVQNVMNQGAPERMAEVLSAMELFVKTVKDDERFKMYLLDELAKERGKHTSISGTVIETMEGGQKYHYEKCGDCELIELEAKLEAAKCAVDVRKSFLKSVPAKGLDIVDKETGETYTIFPPQKTSVSTYKVTLAR